jgi:hypothetical protein
MAIVNSASKTRKEIEAISEKLNKTKLNFSDIIIPILVVVILALLGIFVFVPMIKAAISFQSEHAEIVAKEEKLKKLENTLNNMDEGTLQIDLVNAKKVIPNTLKVSSFMYYIDNLASQKNLDSSEISAGDIKINAKGETSEGNYILGVSGPLQYQGKLNDVLSFLDSLYSASPYILTIENLKLESYDVTNWRVSLSVTGYYVPESNTTVNLYSNFDPYTNYSDIVTIFETKASQLD